MKIIMFFFSFCLVAVDCDKVISIARGRVVTPACAALKFSSCLEALRNNDVIRIVVRYHGSVCLC